MKKMPRWLEGMIAFFLVLSIPLAIMFAIEGKTGSLLLQVAITMSLLDSKFDLFERWRKKTTPRRAIWLIRSWVGVQMGLTLLSVFLHR